MHMDLISFFQNSGSNLADGHMDDGDDLLRRDLVGIHSGKPL